LTTSENTSAVSPGGDRGPARTGTPARGTLLTRRAAIGPATLDREARTAEAIVATSDAVSRSGQRPDGSYGPWFEQLDISGANLDRFRGAPVLLDHAYYDSKARVGAVADVRIENGLLVATLRFSRRSEVDGLLDDIRDGIARQISVGYTVQEWAR
jgi:hypothetical protein